MGFVVIFTALLSIKEFRDADIWHYNEDKRIEIWGMQPNMLGLFFAQYIPIFASFAFLSKNKKSKLFYVGIFSLCIPGLMFTYSRGAYLGILGAFLLMGILGGRKIVANIIILGFVAIIAQAIIVGHGRIIPVSVQERFESIGQEDKSIALRKQVWDDAKRYISKSPIFGYGYGSTDRLLFMDTHNMYLKLALESGIPTLLIFIWFVLAAFKTAFKLYKITDNQFYKSLALGLMGSITALVIGNNFGSRLLLFAVNGYFAILMGMVAKIYADQINLGKHKVNKTRLT